VRVWGKPKEFEKETVPPSVSRRSAEDGETYRSEAEGEEGTSGERRQVGRTAAASTAPLPQSVHREPGRKGRHDEAGDPHRGIGEDVVREGQRRKDANHEAEDRGAAPTDDRMNGLPTRLRGSGRGEAQLHSSLERDPDREFENEFQQ